MSQYTDPNDRVDYTPAASPEDLSWWAKLIARLRNHRNTQDAAQAKAAADNAPIREADARRKAAQGEGK
jgi:hypothetical protein